MARASETTTIRTKPEVGELRFVIDNVSWDRYEALLELFGDDGPRMNYCRGALELMSPSFPHERSKKLLGFMVETLTEELEIEANSLGSSTFRRQLAEKGLESDESYSIANAGKITNQRHPDLDVDPPPDLAIEIEITSSLVDKLSIYAGIGVPEIWRFDGEHLTVLLLRPDGTYATSPTSSSFPFLPMGEILTFLEEFDATEETRWRRSFRAWVREVLLPIYRNPAEPE